MKQVAVGVEPTPRGDHLVLLAGPSKSLPPCLVSGHTLTSRSAPRPSAPRPSAQASGSRTVERTTPEKNETPGTDLRRDSGRSGVYGRNPCTSVYTGIDTLCLDGTARTRTHVPDWEDPG